MTSTGLPAGWEVRHSNSKNLPYYHHIATRESVWEPPAGTDTDQLSSYMAGRFSNAPPSSQLGSQPPASQPITSSQTTASQPTKVRAAHLLIKHSGSRRPASWKSDHITRSREEALQILKRHEEEIRSGRRTLGDIASTESDCSSHSRGGDLGNFGRGEMQRPFEEAAFRLGVGEVSGVVETDSGVHLIERLA